ncbi:serine/threonine transporter [Paludibacterium purpuratum]|uniref:Serine transporter n=1 Tax=Paludibacterium purpuratum TaxID=1144873 RepID=A0A4R7BA33_9NEIS|nr:serine/threonine transporter [Paludibacterium purpuratum]TDR80705.1 serine transporter [Paludibacterium purpuratum]
MSRSTSLPLEQSPPRRSAWTRQDTTWMLGLYGTAIGAGTLFLPINAGSGGLWPLLFIALLALPLTFFAHRGLSRFVLSGSTADGDITEVVEEHFGLTAGKLITLLYFFAIYPILLVYSVAMTNTVLSFLNHQLHIEVGTGLATRAVFSLALILGLMSIVRLGGAFIVKAMSILVYPFVCALMLLAFYLIPNWNNAIFTQAGSLGDALSHGGFYRTLWLVIPVMVFSFNHSPIISSFAVDQKRLHPQQTDAAANRTLLRAHILMVVSVMLFVFSCVLSLSPADLMLAKQQNISILSYLANHFQNPLIEWVAPVIAMIAISKSFLGHYLGAKEGMNGLMAKALRSRGKAVRDEMLDRYTAVFMILTCWVVATFNPSILGMIETLGGPVIALLLFLMPMYAIHKVPAMRRYAGAPSNLFVTAIGLIAMTAIFYKLFV